MEEEPTQPGNNMKLSHDPGLSPSGFMSSQSTNDDDFPATQLVVDPRRHGHQNSGLNDDDLADIFCILHPASMSACEAIAQIARDAPEHTISTNGVNLRLRDSTQVNHHGPTDGELAFSGPTPRDIALRFSAEVKHPLLGFRFGRHTGRSDFAFTNTDGARRISGTHFRIYITPEGVIMLEDTSTNGTMVENIMLRGKEKENGCKYKHILEQGTLIKLILTPPEEDIAFVVRIPQRDGEHERLYEQNLYNYHMRLRLLEERRHTPALPGLPTAGTEPNTGPPDLFGQPMRRVPSVPESELGRHAKEWRGGPKYNRIRQVGKGAFATVYLVATKFEGTVYAAKEVEKRKFMKNGILDIKVGNEMKIMSKLKHPYIVQYIEDIDYEDHLYLIMDYVPNGDLGEWMAKQQRLDEFSVKTMTTQLLSALKYLHSMGVTHRDIKPDNILIHSFDPLHVKLTDFGLSKMVENSDETFLRTFCGTLLYCAPEVYTEFSDYDKNGNRKQRGRERKSARTPRYDHAVDIWSLGSVLFYTLSGYPPYPVKSSAGYPELLKAIMTTALDIRPLQRADVTEQCISFIKSMLQVQPENRATIDELEGHAWILGYASEAMDEDEVDMIGDPASTQLEEGTSQLKITSPGLPTEMAVEDAFFPRDTEMEIANSLLGSDSSESFVFMRNPPANPRLFGEVNASALGSSGVIPEDHLNLPFSDSVSQSISQNHATTQQEHCQVVDSIEMDTTDVDLIQPSPAAEALNLRKPNPNPVGDLNASSVTTEREFEESAVLGGRGAATAPSLLGAESLVDKMAMDSPSPKPAVTQGQVATNPTTRLNTPLVRDSMTASLRRPRDETDDGSNGDNNSGETRPAPKRAKSSREIDLPVSKTVFWDEKDKSTWHHDYPEMMLSQYIEAKDQAEKQGEKFKHGGGQVFERVVGSFRKTRSPSVEPEAKDKKKMERASSEPTAATAATAEKGRETTMKRDERNLEDSFQFLTPSAAAAIPRSLHPTTPAASEIVRAASEMSKSSSSATVTAAAGGEDNAQGTFKKPAAVLAKFLVTPDSVIQNINLSIREPFASWGRSAANTIIYPFPTEDRVPKYALKIVLWKQGLNVEDNLEDMTREDIDDASFWISTKATLGIKVNGVKIPSVEPKVPDGPSRNFGVLRNGDVVTVWEKELKPHLFIRFRFECHVGLSKLPRAADGSEPFVVRSADGDEVVRELDQYVLGVERKIAEERLKSKSRHGTPGATLGTQGSGAGVAMSAAAAPSAPATAATMTAGVQL